MLPIPEGMARLYPEGAFHVGFDFMLLIRRLVFLIINGILVSAGSW
jgi:hypothetical protein